MQAQTATVSEAEARLSLLASIVDSSDDAITSKTLDGVITSWNAAAERMYGYTAEEMVGRSVAVLMPPERTDEMTGILDSIRKGSRVEHLETVRVRKDGSLFPISLSVSPIYGKDGSIVGASSIGRDITERKRVDEELVNAYSYARSLIEASLDPLVTISAEGKIQDVNEATIRVTGVPRDRIVGTDFADYFTEPQRAREGYRRVFAEGSVVDYPLTLRSDGRRIDVLYNATLYRDTAGEVLGVFAAARDVTAQKESSSYARSLIEASLDPLVTISGEGKIQDVNEATVRVTGVARDHLIGTDFADYFTDPEQARRGYRRVFAEGSVTDYPLTIRRRDGHLTEVLYNASVYRNADGEVLGVFAAARDVSALHALTDQLREVSTPVIKVWDGVLAVPLIGTLDSSRAQAITETLLQAIVQTGSSMAIIDITGVPTVDTMVAQHLLKTAEAARLMGADCIISGIRPHIAQTIVNLGVSLTVTTKSSLSDALATALERIGLRVSHVSGAAAATHQHDEPRPASR